MSRMSETMFVVDPATGEGIIATVEPCGGFEYLFTLGKPLTEMPEMFDVLELRDYDT